MPELGRASGDCGAGTSRDVAVAGAEGCSPYLLGLATSGQIETDAIFRMRFWNYTNQLENTGHNQHLEQQSGPLPRRVWALLLTRAARGPYFLEDLGAAPGFDDSTRLSTSSLGILVRSPSNRIALSHLAGGSCFVKMSAA